MRSSFSMPLLYHAYVYLEFLILACTIYILAPEARKEVIRLLGGVISGMNVGQPVIMQAANSEAQEPTEDVMDDADVAGLAMGWMSKGD